MSPPWPPPGTPAPKRVAYPGWAYSVTSAPSPASSVVKVGSGPITNACSQQICPGVAQRTRPTTLDTVQVTGDVDSGTGKIAANGETTGWVLEPEAPGRSVLDQLARKVPAGQTVQVCWVDNLDKYPRGETLVALRVA